jgi:uncharacterized protein (TIGR01777 family)
MATILITGGSGLVGGHLTSLLLRHKHEVRWLSRTAGRADGVTRFVWDLSTGTVDRNAFEGVDHIVHLSGAGIADKRWTASRMKELYASRGGAARLLLNVAREQGFGPKSFVSASGVGIYGAVTSDHVYTESDPAGQDAIGRLSLDWEQAADEWSSITRVVKLRTPVVIARAGGALPKLAAPVRWGLGSPLGSGDQWMPWVHIDDLVQAYQHAMFSDDLSGAYNVTAGEQPTNREFTRTLAQVLRKPFFLPNVPAFALRIALGELSSILLEGSRAGCDRLVATGFHCQYDNLMQALATELVGR